MIVFVFSHPRSGSTWVRNVARALMEKRGKTILPSDGVDDNPQAIEEVVKNRKNMKPNEAYLITGHLCFDPTPGGVTSDMKIINTYRDVRDAMLSLMRFTKMDFEYALGCAPERIMGITDHYLQLQQQYPDNVLRIKYNHIVADPVGMVGRVNDFLALGVDRSEIEETADCFSRRRVQELIKGLEQVSVNSEGEVEGSDRGKYQAITGAGGNFDGSYRILDKETAFQTNHISSKRNGEWREVFTPEQQERVNELAADWLKKYGFRI